MLTQNITSAGAVAAGIKAPYPGFTGSVAQALRPFPQYLTINNNSNPNGNSTYNALQTKVTKRLSSGFSLLSAFTWSKSLSDGQISAGGGPSGEDYYNRRLDKGLSVNDVPFIFAAGYTWELPFGKGKRFLSGNNVASTVLGGWQLNGIHQYQTGKPVQLTANNSLPIFNGLLRPNVATGATLTAGHVNPLADNWFNKAAFAIPGNFQFGNAARSYNELRRQNSLNESFGLMKQVKLAERATLTLRGELFNLFNRTVFGAPVANVSAANFGRVTNQANAPRQGLVSLRLDF